MNIAYFDCFSGAAGDMILGALIDAGLCLDHLKKELAKLHLSQVDVTVEKVAKRGLTGSQVRVHGAAGHHHHRHLSDIRGIIEKSGLEPQVQETSLAVFTRLAEAEATVHGMDVASVHFHEVGAVDAIVDIVGAAIGVRALGIEKIYCSPLHVGTGTVTCGHGVLPIPAPATAELIQGKPVYATDVEGELLTPTGAAILTTLAESFGPMPAMTVTAVGYGAGTADRSLANMLRLFIGTVPDAPVGYETDEIGVMETTIDDMNPQVFDFILDEAFRQGALDVFFAPVHMKKNRLGTLLTVLCDPARVPVMADLLFRQTTTIGLRWRIDRRIKLVREIVTVDTPDGRIRCKVARHQNEIINLTPEYDDCKRIAKERNIPLKQVLDTVRDKARTVIGDFRNEPSPRSGPQ